MNKISLEPAEYWSSFQVICTLQRTKGINCDLDVLREGIKTMPEIIENIKQEILLKLCSRVCTALLNQFNLDSPVQLAPRLIELGYTLPKTPKGRDCTSSKWMKQFPKDELLQKIIDYRSGKKIYKDFFVKLLNNMKYTDPDVDTTRAKYARCYPTYKLFGAKRTGRFSCEGPNLQQIPKRHPKWGRLCRSIFCLDDPRKMWYHLDWSGQELRLQVHYASIIKAKNVNFIVEELNVNPSLDLHKWTYCKMFNKEYGNVTKTEKEFVKPINLGLSYGMQSAALCKAIGKPVERRRHPESGKEYFIAGKEGQEVLNHHKQAVPYVYELIELCKIKIDIPDGIDKRKKGYIITLGGRKLRKDKMKGNYVGLNLLIQGSGADMMYTALKKAFETGIDIKCIIHDEFNIEGTINDCNKMQEIMEKSFQLSIPMVVEIESGTNWGNTDKINLTNEKQVL